ncbi:MAG: hypothetical protein CXZ00_03060 [Acidobacteria bacterium]|nr:MAG: hypothetical protein CXZ00_03060 [Acidobacteriota bacterium]
MKLLACAVLLCSAAFAQYPPAPAATPAVPAPSPSSQCIIVKSSGNFSGRFVLSAAVSPGGRFVLVDSYGVKGTQMVFKRKDIELLQSANVKVVVLQTKYTQTELDSARASCAASGAPVPVPSTTAPSKQ